MRGRQPIQPHLINLAPSICMRSSRCLSGKTLPVSMAGVRASVGVAGRVSWVKGVESVSIFVVDSQRAGILINVPQRVVNGRSVLLPLPGLAAQRGRARGGPWWLLRLLLPLLLLLQLLLLLLLLLLLQLLLLLLLLLLLVSGLAGLWGRARRWARPIR